MGVEAVGDNNKNRLTRVPGPSWSGVDISLESPFEIKAVCRHAVGWVAVIKFTDSKALTTLALWANQHLCRTVDPVSYRQGTFSKFDSRSLLTLHRLVYCTRRMY